MRILSKILSCGLIGLMASTGIAFADYPDKPIELIVPYPAGGGTDAVARIMASSLSNVLGQNVIVSNRPGAAGATGSIAAAQAAPDGYTLVVVHESSHGVNPSTHSTFPYDPVNDFSLISNFANLPAVLTVGTGVPVDTLEELVALLKAEPEKYRFGSSGYGGYSHIFTELVMHETQTSMVHIPYTGSAATLLDLIGGHIEVVLGYVPSSLGAILAGDVRALAVASPERSKSLPDVPTFAEAGYPSLNFMSWTGLAAPAGVPDEILDRLNSAVGEVLSDPKVIEQLEAQGSQPDPMSRADFENLVRESNKRWSDLVEAIDFKKL